MYHETPIPKTIEDVVDVIGDLRREINEPPPVRVDDDLIQLDTPGVPYEIPLSRCATPEHILGCVLHLASKSWVTKEMLCMFATLAAEKNGIEINCQV